jgi:cytosine permease
MFLWVVFFDPLGRWTLAIGGLGPSILGAAAAGLLCAWLLFYVPAMWGMRTGRPMIVVASSTFGARGATWVPFGLMALVQVLWFAVATYYATELTLRGLVTGRLLDPRHLAPIQIGGLTLKSPLFLITSLVWSYAAALVGYYLVGVIAALMKVFPVFMALSLVLATLLTLGGIAMDRPPAVEPAAGGSVAFDGLRAFALMIQLVFGFFATAGAASADWGAVARDPGDVRRVGWVGVALASWIVAILALLTVAGAWGLSAASSAGASLTVGGALSFRWAVEVGIGGRLGCAILLVFGLASLAPTCYAAHGFGHRLGTLWPRLSGLAWLLIGTAVAWTLIATGKAARLDVVFSLAGAAFAPVVGAMAADYVRHGGAWPGTRAGINPAGMVAWLAGLAVGLVPTVADAAGLMPWWRLQPAALAAFVVAFAVYSVLARLGFESPPRPVVQPAASSAISS